MLRETNLRTGQFRTTLFHTHALMLRCIGILTVLLYPCWIHIFSTLAKQYAFPTTYFDSELGPPEGDGGLHQPARLGDRLRDLSRRGRHQLDAPVLHDGVPARHRNVWNKSNML